MIPDYTLFQTIVLALVVGLVVGTIAFIFVAEWKRKHSPHCDHLYFPKWSIQDPDQLIGQECSLCHHFNPVDNIVPGYTKNYEQRNA